MMKLLIAERKHANRRSVASDVRQRVAIRELSGAERELNCATIIVNSAENTIQIVSVQTQMMIDVMRALVT